MIDHSFQFLACKYLGGHLEKLQKELAGTRVAEDMECVHQSRVATRRLRAGLSFFEDCFSAKKTKKWLCQMRKITRKLGTARDRDVQILFIEKFLSNLDEEQKQYKRGINRLLLRLRQSREKIQPKVVKGVDTFTASGVLADMHGEIEKVLFRFKDRDVPLQSFFVFQHSQGQVSSQLEDLFSHQGSLANPLDTAGHHQMRISAKRLRYTLEICDVAFEGELKEIVKEVKKVQTSLGDLHDCVVWKDYIEQFIIDEKRRTAEYFGHSRSFGSIQKGLDYLNSHCAKRHDILLGEFVHYWNTISEEGLWDKLQSRLDDRLGEYQESSDLNRTV
jgi:CHAD domain-containing protein